MNIGSISGFVGQAATPAYTASKSAVLGLTRSIAIDYAALGVRCNCVCPGITDTPMLREHLGKRQTRTPCWRSVSAACQCVLHFSPTISQKLLFI